MAVRKRGIEEKNKKARDLIHRKNMTFFSIQTSPKSDKTLAFLVQATDEQSGRLSEFVNTDRTETCH